MVRLLPLTLLLAGCPRTLENSGDRLPDGTLACDFERGVEHLWRFSRGLPPLYSQVPGPGLGWVVYQDPIVPLLGFMHPGDWSANQISVPEAFGVDLLSPDQSAEQLILYVMHPRPDLTSDEVVANEIAIRTRGATEVTRMCRDANSAIGAVGQEYTMEVVLADDTIVFAATNVVFDPGNLGVGPGVTLNAGVNVFMGPVRDFRRLTEDVFLAILWQLMYTGGSGERDSDGDGVPDDDDRFPFDPSRW